MEPVLSLVRNRYSCRGTRPRTRVILNRGALNDLERSTEVSSYEPVTQRGGRQRPPLRYGPRSRGGQSRNRRRTCAPAAGGSPPAGQGPRPGTFGGDHQRRADGGRNRRGRR